MKKNFAGLLVLTAFALHLPVFAGNMDANSWVGLELDVGEDYVTEINLEDPGDNTSTIIAPSNGNTIVNVKTTSPGNTTGLNIMFDSCNNLVGPGNGKNALVNSGDLTISGTGTIDSNTNGTVAAIDNERNLTIQSTTLNGGLMQGQPGAVLTIDGPAATHYSNPGSIAVFNGANLIEAGEVHFTGEPSTLIFNGGTFAQNAILDLSAGNTLQISAGTLTMNGLGVNNDNWAGAIQLFGEGLFNDQAGTGTLILDGFTHDTKNGSFIQKGENSSLVLQSGSNLTLSSGSSTLTNGNVSILSNSTLTVANGLTTDSHGLTLNNAVVTMAQGGGGTLTIADSASSAHTSFTLLAGTSILSDNTININAGNTLNIAGGNVEFCSNEPAGWVGTVNNIGGNLTLGAFNALGGTPVNGKYTQLGGSLMLTGSSILNLDTGSNIIGGNVSFDTGMFAGNIINVTGGTIAAGANIDLEAQNTINISGTTNSDYGSVTFNSGDTWLGKVVNTGQGSLTLDGFTHNTTNGTYIQNNFSQLTLANGSYFTLSTGSSLASGTSVCFTGTGSTLEIAGGTFGAGLALNSNNTLKISNGAVNIGNGNVTSWSNGGNVLITGGTCTLQGFSHDTLTGSYNQSGGELDLTQRIVSDYSGDVAIPSSLVLSTMNSAITGGTVKIGGVAGAGDIGNSLTIMTDGTFSGFTGLGSNAAVTIAAGNTLNVSNGGIAVLNGSGTGIDTWAGTVNVSGSQGIGGNLTLNHISNQAGSIFNQTNGATFLTNGSTLTLNAGSSISGGSIQLDGTSGSTGNVLNISGGNLSETASIDLEAGNTLNISGGSAAIYGTNAIGYSTSIWKGAVNVSGGTFLMDSLTNQTSSTYNQNAGSIGLTDASTLTIGTGSSVTGGTIILDGTTGKTGNTVNITTGGSFASNAAINITAGNNFNVSGGTATLNGTGTGIDNWAGSISLTGGSLTLNALMHDTTASGSYNQSGGGLILSNASTLKLGAGSSIVGGLVTYSGTGNTLDIGTGGIFNPNFAFNITAGNSLNVSGGDATLDSAYTTWNGNVNISGGNLMLKDITVHGNYAQTGGTTTIDSGTTLSLSDSSTLSGGRLIDNGHLNITNNADKTVATSLSGNGVINKYGTGTLLLTGQNLLFNGDLYINQGIVDFNAASGLTDSYISGKTYLNGGTLNLAYDRAGLLNSDMNLTATSTLNLDTNDHTVTSLSNNITGDGTVNKTGSGAYTVLAGSNGAISYNLNVNEGSMNVITNSGVTASFNAPVSVNSSTLRVGASGVSFNQGLSLDHGYLSILNGGFNVMNGLSVGSTINTMNGVVATNNISGNLNVGTSGLAEFLIDISPYARSSDNYQINGAITKSTASGTVSVSDFRIVGPPTLLPSLNLQIFNATGGSTGVNFTATDKIITSILGQYGLSSLGNGNYQLSWLDYNPQVFRGQVATEAAYANQLTTNNVLFDHIGLVTQQMLSENKANVYASDNPLFAPYQYSKKDGSLWYKAYGNLERLQLTQNINTQNNMWGSLVGADFPLVELKNGWSMLPTAYIGYTGAYQTYSGVNMYQNGGQGGVMGTFYKGDFITSLLANVGGYGNDMSVNGTRDTTGNWFAGVASKSAYNIKLPKDFILQPTMLFSYNSFGSQNWSSSFGSVDMTTNMLNGLNIAPGLNLILNKKTWSIYATTQLMFNVMNGVSGTVGDVTLPSVKMGSTYFQYGIGLTKRVKDRLSLYGQIMFSNGVRTGVGFQGGLQWMF